MQSAELGRGERLGRQCGMRSSECGIGARGTITSGDAFLLRRFVVGSRLAMRFWRDVLLSIYAIVCSSAVAFTVGSRLLFVS